MGDPMVSVEFRDGERMVPRHVAILMRGIETHTMLYEQAIRVANQKLLTERLAQAQRDLISKHFRVR